MYNYTIGDIYNDNDNGYNNEDRNQGRSKMEKQSQIANNYNFSKATIRSIWNINAFPVRSKPVPLL